jgi:excisionase family DNA binding protein
MKQEVEKKYMPVTAVADYFSVSRETVFSWVAEGIIPAIQIGGKGKLLILKEDVLKLEEESKVSKG